MNLLDEVRRNYPDLVAQRYKLDAETLALPPYELLEAIGRKRGLLVRGGEVNTERCAIMLVDEFRACKWGRISLERPPQRDDLADFAEEDEGMKRRSDEEISAPLYAFDAEVRSQYGCFAGVDEAGRGPLCGPVCVAACILDPENPGVRHQRFQKADRKKARGAV